MPIRVSSKRCIASNSDKARFLLLCFVLFVVCLLALISTYNLPHYEKGRYRASFLRRRLQPLSSCDCCGQWLAYKNNSDFVCHPTLKKDNEDNNNDDDDDTCYEAVTSLQSESHDKEERFEQCSPSKLPTIATLLQRLPQIDTFYHWLTENLTSLSDVDHITVFAPIDSSINRNISGIKDVESVLLTHMVLIPLTLPELFTLTTLTTAAGTAVPVTAFKNNDTVLIGGARILLSNILAREGVIHIIERPLSTELKVHLGKESEATVSPRDEGSQDVLPLSAQALAELAPGVIQPTFNVGEEIENARIEQSGGDIETFVVRTSPGSAFWLPTYEEDDVFAAPVGEELPPLLPEAVDATLEDLFGQVITEIG